MTTLRRWTARALSTGTLSPGVYALLTGAVCLFLVWTLRSVGSDDRAVPYVVTLLAAVGLRQLARGACLELGRRRSARTVD